MKHVIVRLSAVGTAILAILAAGNFRKSKFAAASSAQQEEHSNRFGDTVELGPITVDSAEFDHGMVHVVLDSSGHYVPVVPVQIDGRTVPPDSVSITPPEPLTPPPHRRTNP